MRTIIGFCLLLSILGCRPEYYSQYYSLANGEWHYDDPLSFTFEIKDTTKIFDMILKLDHTDQYPYQNLYLKTKSQIPGDTAVFQNLSLELANEGGFWLGSCIGTNCSIEIPIQSKVHFDKRGKHIIQIEQYTRTDTLQGLRGIGLTLKELE